jgi:uncharacterized protein DUF1566/GDSL-like lipase/acylhydrolase family protein
VRVEKHVISALTAALLAVICPAAQGGSQMLPTKRPARGLSAFVVRPLEGNQTVPQGWNLRTVPSFGNSAIADESLDATAEGAICETTSYPLPRSDYVVSILVRGKGQVRLAGRKEWTDFQTPKDNYYAWVEVGQVKNAVTVGVELRSLAGRRLNFGGLLAEGLVQPVVPVGNVLAKIKAAEPQTVVLLGDSVTENWGGTGGGSSCFEAGNPGRMLQFLRQTSQTDVDYFTHRLPESWPADRNLAQIPMAEIDGRACYDSRIEKDASKRIHLINLGKGGAASNWGWSRMPAMIVESDYFDTDLAKEQRKSSVRYGLAHYRPNLVIINFGTNDVNAVHGDWLVEDYLFHMRVLATNIQHRFGAAVILSTPHKWTRGVHLTNHRQPAMVDALRDYCQATGFALADVYNEYEPAEYDGIHPGDVGHKHIANAYINALTGQSPDSNIKAQTAASDLRDNGDGTVSDMTTGLIWTRSADLADGGKEMNGTAEFITTFNDDTMLGGKLWRLPTRDEMLKLVDPGARCPALPKEHPFQSVSGWYRTSDSGWGVDMDTGIPWSSSKADGKSARIWLVRNGGAHRD